MDNTCIYPLPPPDVNASALAPKLTFLALPYDGGPHRLALPSVLHVPRLLPLPGVATAGDGGGAGGGGSLGLAAPSLDDAVRLWDARRVGAPVGV